MQRTDLATGKIDEVYAHFHSEIEENLEGTNENELYAEMIARIAENIALFQRRGSNWQFVAVLSLEIHLVDFQPLSGSTFIHLPKIIADKKAVINMENKDDQFFKWSVTRALNPVVKNARLITKELKDQSEKLNWNGLEFPVKLKQIGIFEKENPKISVNVFGFEGVVFPLRISKTKRTQIVNLLLIFDGERNHYTVIKNMSRLLSSQVSGHKESKLFCLRCLNHFPNKEKLSKHEEYCLNNDAIKIEMPEKGDFIAFKHHNRSIKVLFVVYADFEAFTEDISTCEPSEKKSFTKNTRHKPSGFCYKIVCFDKNLKNQFSIEQKMKKKKLVKNSLKCLGGYQAD